MKRLISLVLSVILLASLVGCGESGEHTHTLTKVEAKQADCTQGGYAEHYSCSTCRKVFANADCTVEVTLDSLSTPATGHNWAGATCTDPKHCINCGATDGDPASHTWVEATCLAPKYCSGCGLSEGEPASHEDANADNKCDHCGADVKSGGIDLPGRPF